MNMYGNQLNKYSYWSVHRIWQNRKMYVDNTFFFVFLHTFPSRIKCLQFLGNLLQ
jgi:hypothetical protein